MKVKIEGKRPGKVLRDIRSLSIYDETGNYLGNIRFDGHFNFMVVDVECHVSIKLYSGFKYGPGVNGNWIDFKRK